MSDLLLQFFHWHRSIFNVVFNVADGHLYFLVSPLHQFIVKQPRTARLRTCRVNYQVSRSRHSDCCMAYECRSAL
jgi:hypothetical protein